LIISSIALAKGIYRKLPESFSGMEQVKQQKLVPNPNSVLSQDSSVIIIIGNARENFLCGSPVRVAPFSFHCSGLVLKLQVAF